MVSKSLTTNLVALALIGASYLSPKYSEIMYLTGLFALSGGITNWLAIHMSVSYTHLTLPTTPVV